MPNPEVEELMVVKINRCRIDGCRRTEGHKGEHMDSEALSEHVIESHERYINELESKLGEVSKARDGYYHEAAAALEKLQACELRLQACSEELTRYRVGEAVAPPTIDKLEELEGRLDRYENCLRAIIEYTTGAASGVGYHCRELANEALVEIHTHNWDERGECACGETDTLYPAAVALSKALSPE